MSTTPRNRRARKLSNGNVGAEETRRGFGDIRLWVETQDAYRHSLFLTTEEAERLADLLDELLDDEPE